MTPTDVGKSFFWGSTWSLFSPYKLFSLLLNRGPRPHFIPFFPMFIREKTVIRYGYFFIPLFSHQRTGMGAWHVWRYRPRIAPAIDPPYIILIDSLDLAKYMDPIFIWTTPRNSVEGPVRSASPVLLMSVKSEETSPNNVFWPVKDHVFSCPNTPTKVTGKKFFPLSKKATCVTAPPCTSFVF